MSTAMSFCPECSNLLYPREDPDRRQLMFLCRQCDFARYADKDDREENCVDRQNFNYKSKEDIYISADLAKDPTLGRVPHWRCRKCRHRGAVFYQLPERVAEDAMALVYVCLTPGCGEIEIQMPSASSSSSSSAADMSPSSPEHPPAAPGAESFLGATKREEFQLQRDTLEEQQQQHRAHSAVKGKVEDPRGTGGGAAWAGEAAAPKGEERVETAAAAVSAAPLPVGGGVAAFFAQEEETAPPAAAEEEDEEDEEEEEDLFGEGSDPGESYSVPSMQQKAAEENIYLGADATAAGAADREAEEEEEEEETFYGDALNVRAQQQLVEEDEEEQPEEEDEEEEDEEEEEAHEETHSSTLRDVTFD